MRRDEALEFLARHVPQHFPGADSALLCGSTARDTAKAGSDVDLVVLYDKLPAGAWRITANHDGVLIEAFVHDLATLRYFFSVFDAPSGVPILAEMISSGVEVPGLPSRLAGQARDIARKQIAAGPPPLDSETLERRRFLISSLVDDLLDDRPSHHRLAIAAALYGDLADFALRAAGRFSGKGKGLARALETHDARLAARFDSAFAALAEGDSAPIHDLVDAVLAPYGGRLVDGYQAQAPADWRLED